MRAPTDAELDRLAAMLGLPPLTPSQHLTGACACVQIGPRPAHQAKDCRCRLVAL